MEELPSVEIANEQSVCPVNESLIRQAVEAILTEAGVRSGQVSVALVDDPTIHEINRRHLQHDYPTDVISFVLECEEGYLDGEVVASADTACHVAQELGWLPENELLLYVVHGTLHLVGYDDQSDSDRDEMRDRERHYLARFGLVPPWQGPDEQ